MPKVNRCGQSAILTSGEMDLLFNSMSVQHRTVFAVCRYTACRISEALSLKWRCVLDEHIILEKKCTKTKKTRQIPLHPELKHQLDIWKKSTCSSDWVFPGSTFSHLTRRSVDHALRKVCMSIGLQGVSTHSFRRSALTHASDQGVPLRHIQSLSGHTSLDCLSQYLQVTDAQKRNVTLAFA